MVIAIALTVLVVVSAMTWFGRSAKKEVYGVDHGILNVQMPKTLWMNMGYWKVPISGFQSTDCSGNKFFSGCMRGLVWIVG